MSRPLDRIPSIKVKFSIVIVAAVAVSATISTLGLRLGVPIWLRPVIAAAIALVMVKFLATGMTSPLREMVAAADAMAEGDYTRPVTSSAADEVGQLAVAFDRMRVALERTDRERRDLVANVSHELRTPIAALQATLENIVDGVTPADPETLATMLAQTGRLSRLVAQLLDLARLEAGTAPLQPSAFRLDQVAEASAAEVRLAAADVKIHVAAAHDDLRLVGDPDRIHQVVGNLLHNAVRHSPEGGRIDVVADRPSADRVQVAVTDRGPGLAAGEEERVFERFYRVDASRAADDGGAGLGLSIAREIVELHGGTLRAERPDEGGCRMVIELPIDPGRA